MVCSSILHRSSWLLCQLRPSSAALSHSSEGCGPSLGLEPPLRYVWKWENHRKVLGKPQENHRKMEVYPLVIWHNYGKSQFLRGKLTIHGPFSKAILSYRRVCLWYLHVSGHVRTYNYILIPIPYISIRADLSGHSRNHISFYRNLIHTHLGCETWGYTLNWFAVISTWCNFILGYPLVTWNTHKHMHIENQWTSVFLKWQPSKHMGHLPYHLSN